MNCMYVTFSTEYIYKYSVRQYFTTVSDAIIYTHFAVCFLLIYTSHYINTQVPIYELPIPSACLYVHIYLQAIQQQADPYTYILIANKIHLFTLIRAETRRFVVRIVPLSNPLKRKEKQRAERDWRGMKKSLQNKNTKRKRKREKKNTLATVFYLTEIDLEP